MKAPSRSEWTYEDILNQGNNWLKHLITVDKDTSVHAKANGKQEYSPTIVKRGATVSAAEDFPIEASKGCPILTWRRHGGHNCRLYATTNDFQSQYREKQVLNQATEIVLGFHRMVHMDYMPQFIS
ncbi:hypothetical protein T265_07575 [Opisthorchis viverrini]|uniref:Uncharacterized protein n=1 Tax=Opisthorchis viverrini TaxID=6198 RepID=A0A075AB56_OPIVI|nr:hypothetical protein T265_07575 [Opisthorchis viverrini]KER24844.1 hypothetical protein T265_07575 [Opisthorchis viverrini]